MTKKTAPAWSDEWIVDTNVWIDHFRSANKQLTRLLRQKKLRLHEVVVAELLLPEYKARRTVLRGIPGLPVVGSSSIAESIIYRSTLGAKRIGCGIADFLMLISCLELKMGLWTNDERAKKAAKILGVKLMT